MTDAAPPQIDRLERIADLWGALAQAVDTGDVRVRGFLRLFEPWAKAELQARTLS